MRSFRLKLTYVSIAELRVDPANRKSFDPLSQDELNDLAASIKDKGLINPLTVTPDYLIIAGEQRYTAARLAGLDELPVIIRKPKDDLDLEEIRTHENIYRRNLPLYRAAKLFERLHEIKGLRAKESLADTAYTPSKEELDEQIAKETGQSKHTVKQYRQLARLIPQLGKMLDQKRITRDFALELAKLKPETQLIYWTNISTEEHIRIEAAEAKQLREQFQEMESRIEEANQARIAADELAAKWRALAQERDEEIEAKARKLVEIQTAEARREAKKAKAEAERAKKAERDARKRAAETLKEQKKQYAKEVQAIRKHVTYKFILSNCEPLRRQDPVEVAEKVPLHPELSIAILEGAEAFMPWLQSFAKQLRARCAEQGYTGRGMRPFLKEVR
jgi:ParB family chromosome partitioning protein